MRITLPLSIRRGQRRMHDLLGKICVLFRDTISKGLSLGIQFVMQGNIGNKTQKYITWKPIRTDEGLADVGNGIFTQHLTLFRQEERQDDDDNDENDT